MGYYWVIGLGWVLGQNGFCRSLVKSRDMRYIYIYQGTGKNILDPEGRYLPKKAS